MRYEVERARVEEVMDKLVQEFDLGWITISNLFVETVNEDAIIATTDAEWSYRFAVIEWNLPGVSRITDETLEDVAIHEIIHCLLAPVEEQLPKKDHVANLREFAVESLARMIKASRSKRQ